MFFLVRPSNAFNTLLTQQPNPSITTTDAHLRRVREPGRLLLLLLLLLLRRRRRRRRCSFRCSSSNRGWRDGDGAPLAVSVGV